MNTMQVKHVCLTWSDFGTVQENHRTCLKGGFTFPNVSYLLILLYEVVY